MKSAGCFKLFIEMVADSGRHIGANMCMTRLSIFCDNNKGAHYSEHN